MNDVISIPKSVNITLLDEVHCIITGLFPIDKDYLHDKYNLLTKDYLWNAYFKLGVWDGKKEFFTKKGKTYIFLLNNIIPIVVNFGYKVNLIDKRTAVTHTPDVVVDANYFNHIINLKTKTPYKLADHQIEAANIAINLGSGILLAGTGFGKSQPLTSKVLTPNGWVQMGEIKIDDLVMTPKNTITKVIGVYPQGNTDVYKITCNDGATASCCANHLWIVHNDKTVAKGSKPFTICDTKELFTRSNMSIPHRPQIPLIPVAIDFNKKEYTVSPYVMGAIIPFLSKECQELVILEGIPNNILSRLQYNLSSYGIDVHWMRDNLYRLCSNNENVEDINNIIDLQLDYNNIKIPDEYIYSTSAVRALFLKGLCDTCGNITNIGSISVIKIKESLAFQIQEMVWLQGGACKVSSFAITIHHKDPCVFFSNMKYVTNYLKHSSDAHGNNLMHSRRVDYVQLVSNEPTQCILVEDSDHLYITDNCLITHNTILNGVLIDIYGKLGCKTITVVPSSTLVTQTLKQFDILQLDVGQYDGTIKDLNHQHIVSTWQTLQNNPNLIRLFQVIINDECHNAKAVVMNKLLAEYGKNIAHRFGLTGTLPDHPVDLMLVKVVLGDVIFTSYAKDLIEAGWLATPNISIVQLNDVAYLQKSGVNEIEHLLYEEELHFLKSCITRQQWIANYIIEKSKSSKIGNTLILVNNIVYGKQLTKLIPNAVFLHGKDKDAIRQKVYDLFEVQDDLIVICTKQIAGVGLSIDRIFILIYIDGGKSFINTIQTIGRGLRKGRDKDSVDIIDICGNMVISNNHLKQRIKYYKGANYFYKKHTIEYYNGDINLC